MEENSSQKLNEEKIIRLREEFLKTIPQLKEIQDAQNAFREVKEKEMKDTYPFIDTQSHSTV